MRPSIYMNGIPNPDWHYIKLADLLFAFYQNGYECSKSIDSTGNKFALIAKRNIPNSDPRVFSADLKIEYDNPGLYKAGDAKVKIDLESPFWKANETREVRKMVVAFLESYDNGNDWHR